MAPSSVATHDAAAQPAAQPQRSSAPEQSERTAAPPKRPRTAPARPTDDEILGIDSGPRKASSPDETPLPSGASLEEGKVPDSESRGAESSARIAEPPELRAVLDANPDLRTAWEDAQAYRESIASPEDARKATAQLADLDRMDTLFFSSRPEDHAELARLVASLDPAAFASLAQAMSGLAAEARGRTAEGQRTQGGREASNAGRVETAEIRETQIADRPSSAAQAEFYHATNAATVQGVIDSIESQVDRLLPEGVSKSARNRVVGEIYRELDVTLRSNRQLAHQMREAFRSGSLDVDHQRAIVSLITGRARQALPGVAKRVLNEWTSTLVAAGQERRSRQRTAERRVDIAGSSGAGNDGRRSMSPREIDYARMSDADILNL